MSLLIVLLRSFADEEVRDSLYLGWYMVLGAAWVGVYVLGFLGVRTREDAVERRNTAAASFIGWSIVGLTLAFSGANFGDGCLRRSLPRRCSPSGRLAAWARAW